MKGFDVGDFLDALVNPFLLTGALVTAALTVAALLGGFLGGLLLALLRSAKSPIAARAAQGYIWFFRGTPLLIQMVMIYSGLPQLGIKFSVITSVIVALVLNEAALHGRDHPRRLPGDPGRPERRRQGAWPVAPAGLAQGAAATGHAHHPAGDRQFGERGS